MDRLVAGDVGYGKTEVALRAAFKVVADGMQAAVLVPTTVLAQQHWTTFADRFAAFPARVELLSRFRSPKEQKAVIEGLRQRSEEHTSELQSPCNLVCRLLLEKKKK